MLTDYPSPASAGIDLTHCDREPIHIPGSIQPHGVLLVLSSPEMEILQVSQNTLDLLGIPPEELLATPLEQWLGAAQIQEIQKCLDSDFESVNPLKIQLQVQGKPQIFEGIIHRSGDGLILELEPSRSEASPSFFNFYQLVKTAIARLQQASTLEQLCQVIVQEIRQITGFDRVMVYQFSPAGAGSVIAEAKRADLSPFLGLHYPGSDIPKQARRLYELNLLRLIPDVHYQPVGFLPANPPDQPLDLSLSVLRSVSPVHLEYLNNMGVGASMSISLLKDQQLWGLIACHHDSPRHLCYETRTACEFLGQVTALELGSKEENQDLDYKIKLKRIQAQFIADLSQADSLVTGLVQHPENLLDLVGAQGVAISTEGNLIRLGQTPEIPQIWDLIRWIETQVGTDVIYASAALAKTYAAAETFKEIGSGVLLLVISRVQQNYILWFRPEVIQTVHWGGNPHKPVEVQENGEERLSPRKSFELWKETVYLQSLPWKRCEIEAALELQSAIVGIVLRRVDELARINLDLERSNSELDAFAYIASHDLKEPLRGIHNYSSFLIEDYADVLTQDGVAKLETLVRLTQRMENLIDSLLHFSRLGRIELSLQKVDLNGVRVTFLV